MSFDKLTRRDFMKKTTVLTLAASSATLMTGLANPLIPQLLYWAYQQYHASCDILKFPDELPSGTSYLSVYNCYAFGDVCVKNVPCGTMYRLDPDTNLPMPDPEKNDGSWIEDEVSLNCLLNREGGIPAVCLQ